jgi:hypothetical protein
MAQRRRVEIDVGKQLAASGTKTSALQAPNIGCKAILLAMGNCESTADKRLQSSSAEAASTMDWSELLAPTGRLAPAANELLAVRRQRRE